MTSTVFNGRSVLAEHADPDAIRETIQELQRRHGAARDFNVPAGQLQVLGTDPDETSHEPTGVALQVPFMDGMPPLQLGISDTAHTQLASRLGIHGTYYRRLREEAPGLLMTNANHWLSRYEGSIKVRELDGTARAFMTPNYRALDNFPALLKVQGAVEAAGARIFKMDLTDDSFFVRALLPDWAERIDHQHRDVREEGAIFQQWLAQSEEGYFHRYGETARNIPDEDWVIPGANIRNSETGQGGLSVQPWFLRVICMNGTTMVVSYKRVHLGAKEQDGLVQSDEVRQRENELIFAQMGAAVSNIFDRENFRQMIALMTDSTKVTLGNAPATIAKVSDNYDLREDETQSIINRILHGGDATVFGLVQAVTALARDSQDADRQYDLEQVGGKLLENPTELVVVRR